MNRTKQMAALSLTLILIFLGDLFQRSDASIYAYGKDNRTQSFSDEEASFGQSVGPDGLVGVLYLGEPHDGCGPMHPPTQYIGSNDTVFQFVLIKRGDCDFAIKVLNAQNAGYHAAIVYNVDSNDLLRMSSGKPEIADKVFIPSVFVGRDTAAALNKSYMYDGSIRPYIELNENRFNPLDYYLIPFVVVIAVCFIALLCFLLIRCARDYRRTLRNRLSRRRLKKLPVKKFKKNDEYDVCAICLEDYIEGEVLRILPCQHAYHCGCVDPWLTSNKRICPLCKRKVLSDDDSSSSSEDEDVHDSSDDENTPLVPASEAASPNAPRYGTGFTVRNPFVRRMFRRRISLSSDETTSTDTSDTENIPGSLSRSTRAMTNVTVESSRYQSQDLTPPNISDGRVSNEIAQANAYLDSAEALLTSRSRVSESSITVLSDDEAELISPEAPSRSSTEYHTVDESVMTAQSPYNLESQVNMNNDSNQEDIIVLGVASRANVRGEEA